MSNTYSINQNQTNMSNFKRSDDNVTAILEEYLSKDELNSKDKKSLSEKISIRCGVDLSVWKIDNFRIVGNLWTVHGKFGSVEEGNQRWDEAKNRQLKIIIAYKRIAPDNANTFVKDFLELLTEKSPVVKKIHEYNINNGAMM